jgi:hypothetical protein
METVVKNIEEIRRTVASQLGVDVDAFASKSVCVFPHFPIPQQPYTIGSILDALGITPQAYSPWKLYDMLVCFEDRTCNRIDVPDFVQSSALGWVYDEWNQEWRNDAMQVRRYINAQCTDISKKRVGRVFEEVFGYALDVDPRVTSGPLVRKSDINAAHDGRIITGPISQAEYERDSESVVYSVQVNNVDGEFIDDLRVLWCDHVAPMLDRKRRPVTSRFGHGGTGVFIEPVASHFTPEEVELLGRFCRAFGLDYGELDVLRDRDSGRLYVVDVNKTPNRPLSQMDAEYATAALTGMAVAFAEGFLRDGERGK